MCDQAVIGLKHLGDGVVGAATSKPRGQEGDIPVSPSWQSELG
jgi:hypothetical protein